jgi:hypothetical protein
VEHSETDPTALDQEFLEIFPPHPMSVFKVLSLLTREELEFMLEDAYNPMFDESGAWRRRLVERARLIEEAERVLREAEEWDGSS